jgi:hypothetical protein
MAIDSSDLPLVFQSADRSSIAAQSHFLTAVAVRLIGLVAAGAFGIVTWKTSRESADWAGIAAAICFVATIIVEIYLLKARPERTWYEGRAAAESIKTLSWRYAVGGQPFNIGSRPEIETEALFLKQLESVIDVLKGITIVPPSSAGEQISAPMRKLRISSLDDRKQAYESDRVEEQQKWYLGKAALSWTLVILGSEIAGVTAAIMKATGIIEGDFLIFAGAAIAAMTAWLETKQYQNLSTAYAITAIELASIRTKIRWQTNENDWAQFVNDAEEAFSREHTLWKASRGIQSI